MLTATLRQVGGSVMLALPPAVLDQLSLGARSQVALAVEGNRIVIEPQSPSRPSLEELLAQCDPSAPMPQDDGVWTSGAAVGHELI